MGAHSRDRECGCDIDRLVNAMSALTDAVAAQTAVIAQLPTSLTVTETGDPDDVANAAAIAANTATLQALLDTAPAPVGAPSGAATSVPDSGAVAPLMG